MPSSPKATGVLLKSISIEGIDDVFSNQYTVPSYEISTHGGPFRRERMFLLDSCPSDFMNFSSLGELHPSNEIVAAIPV